MASPYDEILQILSTIESKKGLPKGMLKEIYDMEMDVVHFRTRTLIHNSLQRTISIAAEEAN